MQSQMLMCKKVASQQKHHKETSNSVNSITNRSGTVQRSACPLKSRDSASSAARFPAARTDPKHPVRLNVAQGWRGTAARLEGTDTTSFQPPIGCKGVSRIFNEFDPFSDGVWQQGHLLPNQPSTSANPSRQTAGVIETQSHRIAFHSFRLAG